MNKLLLATGAVFLSALAPAFAQSLPEKTGVNTAMGIGADYPTQVVDNLAYAPITVDRESLMREALARRPEYRQAQLTAEGKTERRFFVQLAGAGLDARAIELVSWPLKKKLGPLAYVIAGLRASRERRPLITASNGPASLAGELILIGNAIGFVFAVVSFALSVISFPLLLDRDVSMQTAIRTSLKPRARQSCNCLQAVSRTHAPIAAIEPVASASGMNLSGITRPSSGCCQRISASMPITRSVLAQTCGW